MIVDSFTSDELIRAIDQNLRERGLYYARCLDGGQVHAPNPLWYETGRLWPNRNGVVHAHLPLNRMDREIRARIGYFRKHNLPFTWTVGPSSGPRELTFRLQAHGMTHNRTMMGLAADIDDLDAPLMTTDTTFERVTDMPLLRAWYDVNLASFPIFFDANRLEAMRRVSLDPESDEFLFVARHRGEIVAAVSLFLGGGAAGLYDLGTLPDYRRRGLGAWMTVHAFRFARERGYRVATLQTTYPNALRLYCRMGFDVYTKHVIYTWIP